MVYVTIENGSKLATYPTREYHTHRVILIIIIY